MLIQISLTHKHQVNTKFNSNTLKRYKPYMIPIAGNRIVTLIKRVLGAVSNART